MSLLSGVQVKKERSALVQGEKHKTGNTPGSELTAPQRLRRFRPATTAPLSPYSRSRSAARSPFPKCEDSSSLVSTTVASATVGSDHRHHGGDSASRSRTTPRLSRGEAGNPVLEGEAQRLEALKRRRFMELQQMLAFQLRSLAREVRKRYQMVGMVCFSVLCLQNTLPGHAFCEVAPTLFMHAHSLPSLRARGLRLFPLEVNSTVKKKLGYLGELLRGNGLKTKTKNKKSMVSGRAVANGFIKKSDRSGRSTPTTCVRAGARSSPGGKSSREGGNGRGKEIQDAGGG